MKNVLIIVLLATVGLFAESNPEFSLKIHPIHETSVPNDAAITLEVTTTNLTDRRLDFMEYGKPYTYIVRRDGVPAPKIAHSDMIMTDPKGLRPHRSVTADLYVNQYVDMSQPGTYTIQLEKDGVKSNVVRVTVEP